MTVSVNRFHSDLFASGSKSKIRGLMTKIERFRFSEEKYFLPESCGFSLPQKVIDYKSRAISSAYQEIAMFLNLFSQFLKSLSQEVPQYPQYNIDESAFQQSKSNLEMASYSLSKIPFSSFAVVK